MRTFKCSVCGTREAPLYVWGGGLAKCRCGALLSKTGGFCVTRRGLI